MNINKENTMEFLKGIKEKATEVGNVMMHDVSNILAVHSLKKGMTLEYAIVLLEKNLVTFEKCVNEIEKNINENIDSIKIEKENFKNQLKESKERGQKVSRALRKQKELEFETFEKAIQMSNKELEKSLKFLNGRLTKELLVLKKIVSKKRRLFSRFENQIDACETTDDVFALIVALKENMQGKQFLVDSANSFIQYMDKRINSFEESEVAATTAFSGTISSQEERVSTSNLFIMLNLVDEVRETVVQNMKTQNPSYEGYITTEIGNYSFEFHTENKRETYVKMKQHDETLEILRNNEVVCSLGTATSFIFDALLFTNKIQQKKNDFAY